MGPFPSLLLRPWTFPPRDKCARRSLPCRVGDYAARNRRTFRPAWAKRSHRRRDDSARCEHYRTCSHDRLFVVESLRCSTRSWNCDGLSNTPCGYRRRGPSELASVIGGGLPIVAVDSVGTLRTTIGVDMRHVGGGVGSCRVSMSLPLVL